MQVRSACLGVHDCSCQNNNVAGAGAYEAYDGKSSPGVYPQEILQGDRTIVESEVPPDGALMTQTFFAMLRRMEDLGTLEHKVRFS